MGVALPDDEALGLCLFMSFISTYGTAMKCQDKFGNSYWLDFNYLLGDNFESKALLAAQHFSGLFAVYCIARSLELLVALSRHLPVYNPVS